MHTFNKVFLRGLTLLAFSALFTNLHAQRTAPVFGDASRLLELLYKDYSTVSDYLIRNEEIAKDRNEVIQIFVKYHATLDIDESAMAKKTPILSNQKTNWEVAKGRLKNYLESTPKSSVLQKTIDDYTKIVIDTGKFYFQTSFEVDDLKFKGIVTFLKKTESQNSYLEAIATLFSKKYENLQKSFFDQSAQPGFAGSIDKGIPLLGSGGFDMAIQGLSKFLAGRIKEELTTYVIERVKEELRKSGPNDPLAEFKVLLPRTNAYLLSFNADQLANFSGEIKQYIEDDFNHLLENIGGLRNTPRIKQLLETYPELDLVIESLELIPKISKIKNPVDYFTLLDNTEFTNRWIKNNPPNNLLFNLGNGIRMSAMLAYSLTLSDNGELRFANTAELTKQLDDPNFYLLYFGLLSEQNRTYFGIKFKSSANAEFELKTGFEGLMTKIPADKPEIIKTEILDLKRLYLELGTRSEQIAEATASIRKANKLGKKIGADTIKSYIDGLIDYSEFLFELSDSLGQKLAKHSTTDLKDLFEKIRPKTTQYLVAARKTNEIIYDLQSKNYAIALIKAFELTTEFVPDNSKYTNMLATLNSFSKKNFKLEEIPATEWAEIIKHFDEKANKEISKSVKKAAQTIEREITAITIFYNNPDSTPDSEVLKNLFLFQKVIQQLSEGEPLANYQKLRNQIQPIIDAFKNSATKNKTSLVVLQYYCNKLGVNIETGIIHELEKLTVPNTKTKLFLPEEIARFKLSISTIKSAVEKYVFSNNKADLIKTFKDQKDTLIFMLTILPNKFNFKLSETTLKLIHFVNDMAVAKDADEISKAIEALALPSGSYTIKRTVKRNISINAYPGLTMAGDVTYKDKVAYLGFSPAFTAPIGINLGWSGRKSYSHSIFVSIIDIGAFTRMYLTKSNFSKDSTTTVSTLPQATFLTVFAPGVHYSLGFKNMPLSLNLGVQYGPALKTTLNTGEVKNYESIRFCAGLVLDIPLLNLHTKVKSFGL